MVEVRLDFETWAREAGFFTYNMVLAQLVNWHPFRLACSVLIEKYIEKYYN
jgi:hypothetical protein